MSFIAQDFDKLDIITVLEGRTQAVIRNHFLRYNRSVRCQVKIITMDMFSPYYDLARQLFPNAKVVLDRFHIVQHLSRAMSRVRVQIMNQFERKSFEYKAIKRYWKLIEQDSRKLSDKRFYRPKHQKRKDEFRPFSSLAFLQPTTVDKEPSSFGLYSLIKLNKSSTSDDSVADLR